MEKLVRDKIPEIMAKGGLMPVTRILASQDRLQWLISKLGEETLELTATPNLEECADVFEVVLAIALELGYSSDELEVAALKKKVAKGGFAQGVVIRIEG
ncbi:MAG: hypothetical protein A2Z94_06380 [Gallionellales bacterium GWA2_55_18]|nr:MAG: hypothetical protein A2Z94_06380 [Gallionellales bacterium GWA2_55_18]